MFENWVKKGEDQTDVEGKAMVDEVAQKTYEKPRLIAYGDVRDVTLGPTNGEGESGNALFFRVPQP